MYHAASGKTSVKKKKDSNISLCSICCVLSFCNLGSREGGTDGGTISSTGAWAKQQLPLQVAPFLGHFLSRRCQSLSYLQRATRALGKHTTSLCAKVCKRRRPSADLNQTSDLPSHAWLLSLLSPLPGNQGCLCLSAPSSHTEKAPGFSFHFKGGVGCCIGDGA